ncbi:MAG: hypothetical protein IV105_24930 [Rhizobacter sp.]|nr:hypothetical protein [Rhizobacter sp.]
MYVTVPFPIVDLQFLDYAALAILLALLYLASTLELLAATASKTSLPLANEINLQKAASWSVTGIALTLVAGLFAGANNLSAPPHAGSPALPSAAMSASSAVRSAPAERPVEVSFTSILQEYGGLLVPVVVLARWLTFHMRGSRVVKLDLLAQELSDSYRREILKQLGESPGMRATKDELFLACSKNLIAARIISGLGSSFSSSGILVRMVPIDIADKLTFTYARMEALLTELENEKKVFIDAGTGKWALKGAPPLPPPPPSTEAQN